MLNVKFVILQKLVLEWVLSVKQTNLTVILAIDVDELVLLMDGGNARIRPVIWQVKSLLRRNMLLNKVLFLILEDACKAVILYYMKTGFC